MKENETIEGNRLIAKFCGHKLFAGQVRFVYSPNGASIQGCNQSCLQYHTSWDWLMPVVKKIQQLSIEDFSKKKPVMNALMDVEIEMLWREVVSFIKFYNYLTKKQKAAANGSSFNNQKSKV